MATLSARGAKELVRVSRETACPDDPSVTRRLSERVYRSDHKCLERSTCWFRDPMGERKHVGAWTVRGNIKPELTPALWAAIYRKAKWEVRAAAGVDVAAPAPAPAAKKPDDPRPAAPTIRRPGTIAAATRGMLDITHLLPKAPVLRISPAIQEAIDGLDLIIDEHHAACPMTVPEREAGAPKAWPDSPFAKWADLR